MRLPLFYPTVDGGWREVWVGNLTPVRPDTIASDGNSRERDVSNFILYNILELNNIKLEGPNPPNSTRRKGG